MESKRHHPKAIGAFVWKCATILAAIGAARFCANDLLDDATRRLDGGYPAAFAARSQENRASSAAENDETFSPARRLLKDSIARLEELRSLSADFDFETNMFGEQYFGRGRYEETSELSEINAETSEPSERNVGAQRIPLEETRFRLRASTGKSNAKEALADVDENVLEVVCDAESFALWTYLSIEGKKKLAHINIEDLASKLARLRETERQQLADAGVDRPCGANGLPGLGGLSGTLKRLDAIYQFAPNVENADWNGSVDVVKIVGTMKSEYLAERIRALGVETLEPFLAENTPTKIEIYFGKDWPFPYKIQYFSISDGENPTRNNIFSVEYSSVVRNDATVRPENFNYNPPQINFDRATIPYLKSLIPEQESEN